MSSSPPPRLPRESVARLVAKSIEWRITGIILGSLISYVITGSWTLGALFGGTYNVIRLALMPVRDRIWGGIRWGWTDWPTEADKRS